MFTLPIAFASPWILAALISLPAIWWLLRLTPPRPQQEVFPPTRILARLREREETPAQSPWWLTLLRLAMAGLVIFAMAGPVLNPNDAAINGEGPVLIVMDDGWTSATDFENRRTTALSIVERADAQDRTIMLVSTTNSQPGWTGTPIASQEAAGLLEIAEPQPLEPDHLATLERINVLEPTSVPGIALLLSDGIERQGTGNLLASLDIPTNVYIPDNTGLYAIRDITNDPEALSGTLSRIANNDSSQVQITGRDTDGVPIATSLARFEPGNGEARFSIDAPVELRNQISRLELDNISTAGAVQLLDDNNRRRLVGLISGETFDQSQPLLSPLYYISRAMEPFSDVRRSDDANIAAAVPDLIQQRVSVIILADVGTLPQEVQTQLSQWVERGGMLVRFAGPRLGAAPEQTLLPVDIRPGDRSLGGALSWEEPKAVAPFGPQSPFAGIEAPRDVLVTKQLLALQETNLDDKTWARLEDGTPLVTAEKREQGWLVFFHVGSDASWSNLPLSGTFVEMLRRTVNLSRSTGAAIQMGQSSQETAALPPLRLLDGRGSYTPASALVKPLLPNTRIPSPEHPPGFYGTTDGYVALNLFDDPERQLTALNPSTLGFAKRRPYASGESVDLRNVLLVFAAALLLLDCFAVLWMGGALSFIRRTAPTRTASTVAAIFIAGFFTVFDAKAQEIDVELESVLKTRLAYVITGVEDLDATSAAGMRGLTAFITSRTALEPGRPIGLDPSSDELSFYSLIYWPIDPAMELPDPATMSRIDAYMKEGGSILFDTRDQIAGVLGGTSASPAAQTLQIILSGLDIPPLEPVPSDHVLTKSFYLLERFPGRYAGGQLWVEANTDNNTATQGRPARAGDGVSSILITSNDLAGAWAVDEQFRSLYPTVPANPQQRIYAYRAGVNLMMYALTGNYKADQVHLPALLERLGQ